MKRLKSAAIKRGEGVSLHHCVSGVPVEGYETFEEHVKKNKLYDSMFDRVYDDNVTEASKT